MRKTLVVLTAAVGFCAAAKEIHQTFPLALDGHVRVETYKGEVHVTPWDQAQVEVSVRIEADGTSDAEREAVDRTEIRMEANSSGLHLKSDYGMVHQRSNVRLPFTKYEIHMPRTARLEVKDYKSDIDVAGLASAVEIESYKGDMRLRGLSGSLRLNSYKGHGTFDFARFTGASSIETYRGTFDVAFPQNAGFDLVSQNGRRSSVRSAFAYTLPAGTYHGNDGHFQVKVNGGGPELVLKSYRGEFNLH